MNEARISITPYCNYRCFFCHNEGLAKGNGHKPQEQDLQFLITKLLNYGYNDLTFTGGEPFLYPELLIKTLSWLQKNYAHRLPSVTIVSNGSLIKEEHLLKIKSYPRLKFHISLHTSNAQIYQNITQQKHNSLEQIIKTLQLLKDFGYTYKINYVLLRGINTQEDEIWRSIDLAEKYQAKAIKFLELLVMENNAWLFPYFFDIKSAESIIRKKAKHVQTHNRRKVYQKKSSPLEIELQQLTCKIGCSKCLQNRDHTFSAQLKFYPCMEASDISFDLRTIALEKALKNGKKIIGQLAAKYKNRSPSLLQETRYTQSRKELFIILSRAKAELLTGQSLLLEQKHFKDWYYRPRTADEIWEERQQLIKIRMHFTNEYQAKIIGATVIMEQEEDLQYQRTIYWDEKQELFVGELKTAKKFMRGLDMVCWYEGETKLQMYRLGHVEYTVSQKNENAYIIGINLSDFKNLNEAKMWLIENHLPLKGRRLTDLLVHNKE